MGSHGTALSVIINQFDKTFSGDEFEKIRRLMPWIVKFAFDGAACVSIRTFNLFDGTSESRIGIWEEAYSEGRL